MNPWDEIFAEALRTGGSDGLIKRFYELCLGDSEQRLLNAEANAAWATEQRIIKLLEANLTYIEYEGLFQVNTPIKPLDVPALIALIKGENK